MSRIATMLLSYAVLRVAQMRLSLWKGAAS
jgi:hypothetical protein